MYRVIFSPIGVLFLCLVTGGVALIIYSFLATPGHGSGTIGGFRALGAALFFFGAGELLNHPAKERAAASPESRIPRTPCHLGTLFDMVSIVCLFIAISKLLFPQAP